MASTFKFLDRKSSEDETSVNDRAQLIMQLAQQQMRQQRNNQRAFALLLEKAAPSQRTTGGTDAMGKDKKAVQEPVKAKREQGQWDLDVIQEFVINDMQWGQPSNRQKKHMGRKVKAMELSIEDLILPPVPANDSPETYAELLETQELGLLRDDRAKDIEAQLGKDGIIAAFKEYSDEHGLQTNWDFVRMVLEDVQTICLNLKFAHNRVRPSTLAQHLEIVLSPHGDHQSPSYPSFHSTAGRVLAEVISGAYAGHREKLMRIGDTIGMNRVIGGYHFLTDHQVGQSLGSQLVLKIPQNLSINPVYETERTVDGRTAEAVAANFMDALEQRHRTMAVNKEQDAEDNYNEGIRAAMATHARETAHMTDVTKARPDNSDDNIFSGSNDPFLAAITHPTSIARRKGKVKKDYPIRYGGRTYEDAEEAYTKLIREPRKKGQNPNEEDIMHGVNRAKLKQHPRLAEEITARGGVEYLKSLSHDVPTTYPGSKKLWEGKGIESKMLQVLARAYVDTEGVPEDSKKGIEDFRAGLSQKRQFTAGSWFNFDDKTPARNDVLTSTENTYNAILTGDRTSTTRVIDRSQASWHNVHSGSVIGFFNPKNKKEIINVRITRTAPTGEIPAQNWSRTEGWAEGEHSKYTDPKYMTFKFEPIEDEAFKAAKDKFMSSSQGATYESTASEASSDGNIYPDFEEARAGEDQGFDEAEQERARDTANGVTDFGDELEAARADEETNVNEVGTDPREAFGDAEASSGIGSSDAYGGKYDDNGTDYEDNEEEEAGPRTVTMNSGMAEGVDTLWDRARTNKKTQKLAAHSFEGHWEKIDNPKERVHHKTADLMGNQKMYEDAAEWIKSHGGNTSVSNKPNVVKLMQRNYEQVKPSDAVIAVVTHFNRKAPSGGTAYAVAMGILDGKPVHVYDESARRWVTYDEDRDDWFQTVRPPIYQNFAAVGSREIDDIDSVGGKAITDYMEAVDAHQQTDKPFGGEIKYEPNIPVTPKKNTPLTPLPEGATEELTPDEQAAKFEGARRLRPAEPVEDMPTTSEAAEPTPRASEKMRWSTSVGKLEEQIAVLEDAIDENDGRTITRKNPETGEVEDIVAIAMKDLKGLRSRLEDLRSKGAKAEPVEEKAAPKKKVKPLNTNSRSMKDRRREAAAIDARRKADEKKRTPQEIADVMGFGDEWKKQEEQEAAEFVLSKPLDIVDGAGVSFGSSNGYSGGGEVIDDGTEFSHQSGFEKMTDILESIPEEETIKGEELIGLFSEYKEHKLENFPMKEVLDDFLRYHLSTPSLDSPETFLTLINKYEHEEGNFIPFIQFLGEKFSPEETPEWRKQSGESESNIAGIDYAMRQDPAFEIIRSGKQSDDDDDAEPARETRKADWASRSVYGRLHRARAWLESHADILAAMPEGRNKDMEFLRATGMYVRQNHEVQSTNMNINHDLDYELLRASLGWKKDNPMSLPTFIAQRGSVDKIIDDPEKYLDKAWTNTEVWKRIIDAKEHRDGLSPEDRVWWDSLGHNTGTRFNGRTTEWFKQVFTHSQGIPGAQANIAFRWKDTGDKANPLRNNQDEYDLIRESRAEIETLRRNAGFEGMRDGEDRLSEPTVDERGSTGKKHANAISAAFRSAASDKFKDLDPMRALNIGKGFGDVIASNHARYSQLLSQLNDAAESSSAYFGSEEAEMELDKDYRALARMGDYNLRVAFHQLQHDVATSPSIIGKESTVAALDGIPKAFKLWGDSRERESYAAAYKRASVHARVSIREAVKSGDITNATDFTDSVKRKYDAQYNRLDNDWASKYAITAGMRTGMIIDDRKFSLSPSALKQEIDLGNAKAKLDELNRELQEATKTDEDKAYIGDDELADLEAKVRDAAKEVQDLVEGGAEDQTERVGQMEMNMKATTAASQNAEITELYDLERIIGSLASSEGKSDKAKAQRGVDLAKYKDMFKDLPNYKKDKIISDLIESYESGKVPRAFRGVRMMEDYLPDGALNLKEGEQISFSGPVNNMEVVPDESGERGSGRSNGFKLGGLAKLIYESLFTNDEDSDWNTSEHWSRIKEAKRSLPESGEYDQQNARSTKLQVKREREEMSKTFKAHSGASIMGKDFESELDTYLDHHAQLRSPYGKTEGDQHYSMNKYMENPKYNTVDKVINHFMDGKTKEWQTANPESVPEQATPQLPSGGDVSAETT